MKIKVPSNAAPQVQTIIIKEKRSGCGGGCLLGVLLLVAGFFWYVVHLGGEYSENAQREQRAREAAMTPEQKAAREIEKPDALAVEMIFRRAMRENLRDPDSYKPGAIKYHDHPNGYAYFHEYRAKNGFGGYNQEICGMLCATNSGKRSWTYYPQGDVPRLLQECGVSTDGLR